MAFFPHFASDFSPLFRFLDDYDFHRSMQQQQRSGGTNGNALSRTSAFRAFAPRFDVREVKDAYHLDGELPGVSQKDIEIEFTDPQTLVIKGQIKREYSETNVSEAAADDETNASRQPTVEEEGAETSNTAAVTKVSESKQVSKSSGAPQYKYWISERSVGQFHRSFNFPERVNQDAVRASLKDGILSVVVPKAAAPVMKKIRIE
ncbi:hypothetical protein VTO42DRAFT_328 [Malbranchea cinnamomea]